MGTPAPMPHCIASHTAAICGGNFNGCFSINRSPQTAKIPSDQQPQFEKRAPEIFSQAPLLFMSYYNTLFLLCQLFSLFFICSYFVLFFRFFFYRFLVVIPWLLFFGFYSLAFIPLLLFPYFILWLLFLIFWGSPRISAAYTARSALLRFRIIHAKRLHRYRLHHLRLKRSVGIICRRLCDRIYDVHTLRHLSERRISAV